MATAVTKTIESDERSPQHQLQLDTEFINKIAELRHILETDLLAADAKWTLFVAAALSYRYDSKLIPFPPQYAQEQSNCNIDALISVINDTPKLRVILQNILDQNFQELGYEVIDLLYWVLIDMGEPALRFVEEQEELSNILSYIDEKVISSMPTQVFEVIYSTGSHSEMAFRDNVSNLPVKFAFLGNKLDNYFSILHNGFPQLYENNIYVDLTTNLHTSLQRSPNGAAWGASECGSIISCTAICEFAYDTTTDRITPNKHDKSCVNIEIKNPQYLRLRYLLFYGKRYPQKVLPKLSFLSWIYRHKYGLSLVSYMLLLVSISAANSGSGCSFKLYVSRRIENILDICRRIFVTEYN